MTVHAQAPAKSPEAPKTAADAFRATFSHSFTTARSPSPPSPSPVTDQVDVTPKKTNTKLAVTAVTSALTEAEVNNATDLLSRSAMFNSCSRSKLGDVARVMTKRVYSRGENITLQDEPVDRFWVMADGYARRLRTEEDGVLRHVDSKKCGGTISSLSVIEGARTYATARCVTKQCTAYTLNRSKIMDMLVKDAVLQRGVMESLSARLRQNLYFKTPLLHQRSANEVNFLAVGIAAAAESYPRSALNAVLNQRLTGVRGSLFPNMGVQIPTRVVYIAGFKGLRALIDRNVDFDKYENSQTRLFTRISAAIAPGLIMTPVSSILEASNAGHSNPEPLLRRSLRGTMPRGVREILFGVGLNQMSDFFTERYRAFLNGAASVSAGSITAGIVSGYLSHVPHNMSSLKLLQPSLTYGEVFRKFVDKSAPDHFVPKGIPDGIRNPLRVGLACLFPRGVLVRTAQICVSFVILNGVIKGIENDQFRRMQSFADNANNSTAELITMGGADGEQ